MIRPRTLQALALNALAVAVAVLTLFPLFWMGAVSFMSAGEAAQFPPPLWQIGRAHV